MILDRFSLKGKVAIVTGAGRGIDKGVALVFAEVGADLVLSCTNQRNHFQIHPGNV
jgi:NAD(P)-dependent dehydrogenase (short-subunit alcohol dehydrogenase family)